MMVCRVNIFLGLAILVMLSVGLRQVYAIVPSNDYIVNGDFETVDPTCDLICNTTNSTNSTCMIGWKIEDSTQQNQLPSGWMVNDGSAVCDPPDNQFAGIGWPPLNPIDGNYDIMSFQRLSGTRVLTQIVSLPTHVYKATLSWVDYIRYSPIPMADSQSGTWRVLIKDSTKKELKAYIIFEENDATISEGPNAREIDLTPVIKDYGLDGQVIEISFEEQDFLSVFNVSLDNVSLIIELDSDNDGISDSNDNCPDVPNFDQIDIDGDGSGDVCDLCPSDPDNDIDGDGICGDIDNCPTVANADQSNVDGDVSGDVCDPDDDNDGVVDESDNCPLVSNPDQQDIDGDGLGDSACDKFVDPAGATVVLTKMLEDLGLPKGLENSLASSLNGASVKLADGNGKSRRSVCGHLTAFINKVRAQSGKKIKPRSNASNLIDQAKATLGLVCQVR